MKYIFLVSLLLGLTACKKNNVFVKVDTLDLNIKNNVEWLDVSKMFNANFVVLETSKESKIGKIKKVVHYNEELYIFDSQQEKVLVFGKDGKFDRQIGAKGKGKGEVLRMADFNVHNNYVYISSLGNNKMLIYNLDGTLKTEIRFPNYIGMRFHVLDNGFVSHTGGGSNKSATFYSKKGKILKLDTNLEYKDLRYTPMNSFSNINDSTYMFFSNNDTIYLIDEIGKNLIPRYYIDLNGMNVPMHEIKTKQELNAFKRKNDYFQIAKFYNSSIYKYFLLANNKKFCNVLYNEFDKTYQYAERISFKGFQLIEVLGELDDGLIASWHPYMVALYNKIDEKTFEFIPDTCLTANLDWNPGIVYLTRKK